jgi:lysozyme family protein
MQKEDGLNVTIRKGHKDSLSWPELAPGAYASEPLDIMSGVDGLVGAETFAAVDPHNNNKLARDLAKLAARSEQHRYVFFMSPKYPGAKRWTELESAGVQVWSVDV